MTEKQKIAIVIGVVVLTWLVIPLDTQLKTLWPVVVSLVVVMITHRALWGLLLGAFAGALILSNGNPWQAYLDLFAAHLAPSFESSWKVGAILFTLILGGFASVLNKGGGFQVLLHLFLRRGGDASRRFQIAAAGLGILCFFDGLANSMMVGGVCKDMAEKCGVSKVKLSYIADSTSSAVACIAFISTWIAYQLSMIKEGFQIADLDVNPYLVFIRSIPFNFYCWFTLVVLFVSIFRRFNPGGMRTFEDDAISRVKYEETNADDDHIKGGGMNAVMVPLATLILSFFIVFYILGCPYSVWPITFEKITAAFGSDAGPLVLVISGLFSSLIAILLFPPHENGRLFQGGAAFLEGARSLIGPVFILVAAWIIGSVLDALETAQYLSSLVEKTDIAVLVPTLIFITASLISFSTGTSWGTMGIMFPLAIPIAAAACHLMTPGEQATYLQISVAAVFSGAVFGDHCSPFSDTTIVSSISCGVEPHDHIRTQIPFALITAAITIVFGFLPAGYGVSPFISFPIGMVFLIFLPRVFRKGRSQ